MALDGEAPPSWSRRRGLAAAIVTVAVFGVTIGLAVPLIALVLESRGTGEALIGINSAAQFLGIMLCAPLAPRLIARAGLTRTMLASVVVCAACLALFPALDGYVAWLVIRTVFGAAEGFLFVAAETWINQVIDDRVRARVVAAYATALAAGFATGPLIIAATGIDGPRPFLVGAGVVLAALLPLLLGLGAAPRIAGAPSHGPLALLRLIPVAAASAALFGLLDGGLIALLAVYGVAIGLDTAAAAGLVTTLVVGGIVLQLPIGWLADRTDRARTLAGCATVGTALLLAVPAAVDEPVVLHSLLFVLGGPLGSFWMLAMTALGERFRGPDLAAGNVALTLAYGLGSVAGPALGGIAMEVWPPHGLMAALAAFTAAFAWFALAHARRG